MQDEYLAKCLDIIAENGHMIQYVGGDANNTPYAYTVGLSTDRRYGFELALSGLDPTTTQNIFNCAADELENVAPQEGMHLERVLIDYPARLRKATGNGDPHQFGVMRLITGEVGDVWQVEWPDKDRRLPGDPGYALDADRQRLL